jgi:YggT family protein
MNVAALVNTALRLYSLTIFVYVMLSWLQGVQWATRLRETLEPVCEPYIGLFRRIVPPMGMMDFSPLVALLVLEYLVRPVIMMALAALGL